MKPSVLEMGYDLKVETLSAGLELHVPCIICEINTKLMPVPESYKLSIAQKVVSKICQLYHWSLDYHN